MLSTDLGRHEEVHEGTKVPSRSSSAARGRSRPRWSCRTPSMWPSPIRGRSRPDRLAGQRRRRTRSRRDQACPLARLVVQLDEPALPSVAEGGVPTASGLSRLAAVRSVLREQLAQVIASTGQTRSFTAVLQVCRSALSGWPGRAVSPLTSASYGGVRKTSCGGGRGRAGAADGRGSRRDRPGGAPPAGAERGGQARTVLTMVPPRPARQPTALSGCTSGWGCRWPRCPGRQ